MINFSSGGAISLYTGLSALTASQRGLDITGENIANASTPGYHRQNLILEPRWLGGPVGQGVDIDSIARARDQLIERSLTSHQIQTGQNDAELGLLHQLETLFSPGTASLGGRAANLFGRIQQLAARPDDDTQRGAVLAAAQDLAGTLNGLAASVGELRGSSRQSVEDNVEQVNTLARQIAGFNRQIQDALVRGYSPNELKDQRDQALNQMAALVDVRTTDQPGGMITVVAANLTLVGGATSARLAVQADAAGLLSLTPEGSTVPLTISGGAITGLIEVHNQTLPAYQQRLDDIARGLAAALDTIQATGLGLDGPPTSALGVRDVSDPAAPLATTADLPVQAGDLTVSVTDLSTGQRTLLRLAIDPATQSLQDLATALTTATGGQVTASVTADNRLQLQAQAGYAFDFAGRLPSAPENVAMGGTSAPTVTGRYTGPDNGTYSFQVVGSGTVGVTAGLALEVRDTASNLVTTLNVGQGYTPGSALAAGNGLTVRLSAGTTAAGSFDIPVTAEPDTTGVLAALGVNTLFTGSTASDLAVRADLLASPEGLAASRDGGAGDASNLTRLLDVRGQTLLSGQTLEELSADLVGDVGQGVRDREDQQSALMSLGQELFSRQQAISGVDPNEEIANMLQYQRMFQMAARFIDAVNTTLDSLVSILR